MSSGYQINETELGQPFDVTYDPSTKVDMIDIETDGQSHVTLTKSDLKIMLDLLNNEE